VEIGDMVGGRLWMHRAPPILQPADARGLSPLPEKLAEEDAGRRSCRSRCAGLLADARTRNCWKPNPVGAWERSAPAAVVIQRRLSGWKSTEVRNLSGWRPLPTSGAVRRP